MTLSHGMHPYHLVDMSPWPLTGSISAMMLTTGLVKWFHQFNMDLLILGLLTTVLTMIQWWRDVTREATYQGLHTKIVETGMRWGMILFIVSEVLFFFLIFLGFFSQKIVSSGATVTWAHHAIMEGNHSQSLQSLLITVILGLYFTALQAFEYVEAPFTIADSVFGATFFVATGFHGLHVIVGTSFLMVCLFRLYKCHFSSEHHFGFEAAAWYWHFVDVVWLFLYIFIYWWGG
uniref:Cytochrome c oxidase subunit 3 n=1 Tax=Pagurus nigrofascia TaxID=1929472 RepID=A0A2Z5UY14_9EUCA|nr:cytochrome c oxidase subunit III [Pagurus nigrofascia]QCI56242.1 cytochrome oxidase subunit 3 [Pagurus nigrofascia]BBB16251.1 cytochrome oxidase subunit 3 [Pagurus nigrofascia]